MNLLKTGKFSLPLILCVVGLSILHSIKAIGSQNDFAKYQVIAESLYVRDQPSMDSRITGILSQGEEVNARKIEGSPWAETSEGYFVSARFMQRVVPKQLPVDQNAPLTSVGRVVPQESEPSRNVKVLSDKSGEGGYSQDTKDRVLSGNEYLVIFGGGAILLVFFGQMLMFFFLIRKSGVRTPLGSSRRPMSPMFPKTSRKIWSHLVSGISFFKKRWNGSIKKPDLNEVRARHKLGLIPLFRFVEMTERYPDRMRELLLSHAEMALEQSSYAKDFVSLDHWLKKVGFILNDFASPEFKVALARFLKTHKGERHGMPYDLLGVFLSKIESDETLMGRNFSRVAQEVSCFSEDLVHKIISQRSKTRESAMLLSLMPPFRAAAQLELLPPRVASRLVSKMQTVSKKATLGEANQMVNKLKELTTANDCLSDPAHEKRYWNELMSVVDPGAQGRLNEGLLLGQNKSIDSQVVDYELGLGSLNAGRRLRRNSTLSK